jgi:hypothetical protein
MARDRDDIRMRRSPALVAAAVLGIVLIWVLLLHFENAIMGVGPGCFFHRATGLDCAGCGGTRAFFAFLKGDLATSLRMNPLFLAGLVVAVWFGGCALASKAGLRLPGWVKRTYPGARSGYVALGVILLFWIARNIPAWPFSLLAPP